MFDYSAAIAEARRDHNWQAFPIVVFPWAAFLHDKPGNVFSQNGEDGLLAALFDRIGVKNRWCFEVGAHDGVYLSNTKLLRDQGWHAVLIEADESIYRRLCENAGNARCVNARIGFSDLDWILDGAAAPSELDLGVIDIDGNDVHAWDGLRKFRPRVILIEYNTTGRDGDINPGVWQAGPDTVLAMGRKKGYRPLVKTACNLLFVDEGEVS